MTNMSSIEVVQVLVFFTIQLYMPRFHQRLEMRDDFALFIHNFHFL